MIRHLTSAAIAASIAFIPAAHARQTADDLFVGQLVLVATGYCPTWGIPANGTTLNSSTYGTLFSAIGTRFGGDGKTTFALPKIPAPTNMQYCIANYAVWEKSEEAILASVILTARSTCPSNTFQANGQTVQIRQNEALYSLLGTQFGGDGKTTFALPNLTAPATNTSYCIIKQGIYPNRP